MKFSVVLVKEGIWMDRVTIIVFMWLFLTHEGFIHHQLTGINGFLWSQLPLAQPQLVLCQVAIGNRSHPLYNQLGMSMIRYSELYYGNVGYWFRWSRRCRYIAERDNHLTGIICVYHFKLCMKPLCSFVPVCTHVLVYVCLPWKYTDHLKQELSQAHSTDMLQHS